MIVKSFLQQQEERAKELFGEIYGGAPIKNKKLLFSRLNALIDALENLRSEAKK